MKKDIKSLIIVIALVTVCISLSHYIVIPIVEALIPTKNKIESEKLKCKLGKTLYSLEITKYKGNLKKADSAYDSDIDRILNDIYKK